MPTQTSFVGLRRILPWLVVSGCLLGTVGLVSLARLDDARNSLAERPTGPAKEGVTRAANERGESVQAVARARIELSEPMRAESPKAVHAAKANAVDTRPATIVAAEQRTFGSEAEELSFWNERLPGEKLTLEGFQRSLEAMRTALEQTPSAEVERRAAALEAKLGAQTVNVAQIEERIGELQRSHGAK